jgi:hypothetical protein
MNGGHGPPFLFSEVLAGAQRRKSVIPVIRSSLRAARKPGLFEEDAVDSLPAISRASS